MRVALVGLIFFALAATARADTWVPDDPADPEALARRERARRHRRVEHQVRGVRAAVRPAPAARWPWSQEIAIGDSVGSADVAVAPGGWVAIAWSDDDRQETRLTVLHPDGRRTEQLLERIASRAVAVAIDAAGPRPLRGSRATGCVRRTASPHGAPRNSM